MPTITVSGQSNKDAQKNPFLPPLTKQTVLDALGHNGFPGATYTPGNGADKFTVQNGNEQQMEAIIKKAVGAGYNVMAVA